MRKNQKPTFSLVVGIAACLWILFVNIVFFTGRVDQSSLVQKLPYKIGFFKP
jgi:hypothetical protein